MYNLKANWFLRNYVWVACLWNFGSFKIGTFKNIKNDHQILVHCVNNHNLYGKVVIMHNFLFFCFRYCSKWSSKYQHFHYWEALWNEEFPDGPDIIELWYLILFVVFICIIYWWKRTQTKMACICILYDRTGSTCILIAKIF